MPRSHLNQPLYQIGAKAEEARVGVVMLHGRGAGSADMLSLADYLPQGPVAYLAPQAAGRVWYPRPFTAPIEDNEPDLSDALARIDEVLGHLRNAGIPSERTILMGFSQGACLASDYAARNAERFGGVAALSGGLIGATIDPAHYQGAFAGTPALFGCSDVDPHIPVERVRASAALYREMGADVAERIYPGMGHQVNQDEMDWLTGLITELAG